MEMETKSDLPVVGFHHCSAFRLPNDENGNLSTHRSVYINLDSIQIFWHHCPYILKYTFSYDSGQGDSSDVSFESVGFGDFMLCILALYLIESS